MVNGKFHMVSSINHFRIKSWNTACLRGRKQDPSFSVYINGMDVFSLNEFPQEVSQNDYRLFGMVNNRDLSGVFGSFSDFNVWNYSLSNMELINWESSIKVGVGNFQLH